MIRWKIAKNLNFKNGENILGNCDPIKAYEIHLQVLSSTSFFLMILLIVAMEEKSSKFIKWDRQSLSILPVRFNKFSFL